MKTDATLEEIKKVLELIQSDIDTACGPEELDCLGREYEMWRLKREARQVELYGYT